MPPWMTNLHLHTGKGSLKKILSTWRFTLFGIGIIIIIIIIIIMDNIFIKVL